MRSERVQVRNITLPSLNGYQGGISQETEDDSGNIAADLIEENKNACYLAAIAGAAPVLSDLLHVGFGMSDFTWQAAITSAAREGKDNVVEYLYLFFKAKENQKLRIYNQTLKMKSKVSKKAKASPTPTKPAEVNPSQIAPALFAAAEAGHLHTIILLLELYKDTGKKAVTLPVGARHFTPLMIAALKGRVNVVEYLVKLPGVEVDFINNQKVTALACAIEGRSAEIAKILVNQGANPKHCDMTGTSLEKHASNAGIALY